MKATFEDFLEALSTLGDSDMGKNGKPKMKALNAAIKDIGSDPITSEERDSMLERIDGLDEPSDITRIRLTGAPNNPMVIRVGGVELNSIRIGDEASVTQQALSVLDGTGATYEILED